MYSALIITMIIVSILLILIVLVQNPKGGGLSSSFSGSTQIMSVKNQKDRLSRTTWTFACIIFFLCLVSSAVLPNRTQQSATHIKTEQLENITPDAGLQEAPIATPVATPAQDTEDNNEVK
ncbi:preprotein translocase subunit SecG [Halosquirtibacter laminarini]|uniref:Preprotein translocase subunit SecG n=1 Tax=Halosquirtibacter laminarini TaxID=3374600 RepID=A0AC61NF92_9BACT|nr:preprotein translocase subunit SecG [Prolixibacteraceae bacterium]